MSLPVLTPVSSSNVSAVGYDAMTHRLFVRFTTGSLYRYEGVTDSTYRAFLDAPSKGQFVWQHLRGQYPYFRVA